MCEANAVDKLLSLNFVGLPNEVENALAFKVRNADPLQRPMYHQILYAWYVFRGDFRNGGYNDSSIYSRWFKLIPCQPRPPCTNMRDE